MINSEICSCIFESYMRKLFYLIIILISSLCFQACDMFEAHPYDALVRGEKNLNEKFIAQIEENLKGKTTFSFAFISDTQRWYDETEDMVAHINKHHDVDFIIHGGDLSDFGATHEFIMQRDIMLDFESPWVALLGNHDCLGTGEDVYEEVWGDPELPFRGRQRALCLLEHQLFGIRLYRACPRFLLSGKAHHECPRRCRENGRGHACPSLRHGVQQQCGQCLPALSEVIPQPDILPERPCT